MFFLFIESIKEKKNEGGRYHENKRIVQQTGQILTNEKKKISKNVHGDVEKSGIGGSTFTVAVDLLIVIAVSLYARNILPN